MDKLFYNRIDYTLHFATEEYITTTYEFNTECMISLTQENRPVPTAGLFSALYDQHNTPFIDLASPAARDCPLGFREHGTTAAARKENASGLPGRNGSDAYAQRLQTLHAWAEGVAVTASPGDALDLATKAACKVTGRNAVAVCASGDFLPDDTIAETRCAFGDRTALEAVLATAPAALLLPVEGFFLRDDEFLRSAVIAARKAGIVVIYDERASGFSSSRLAHPSQWQFSFSLLYVYARRSRHHASGIHTLYGVPRRDRRSLCLCQID